MPSHTVYLDEIGPVCDPTTLILGKTYIFKQYPHNYGYNSNFLDNHVKLMRGSLNGVFPLEMRNEQKVYTLVWDSHGTKHGGNLYPSNEFPGRLEVYNDLLNV